MRKPVLIGLFLFFCFFGPLEAQSKGKNAFKEALAVTLKVSGDLSEEYDLDGPLGTELEASPAKSDPVCNLKGSFRKVFYRSEVALEAWLTFECTFEGQKRTYKPHRFYLDPRKSEQKIQLPMLAKNLKNVRLDFQNLSLSKSK